MIDITSALAKAAQMKRSSSKPEILDPTKKVNIKRIHALLSNEAVRVSDTYISQAREYVQVREPVLEKNEDIEKRLRNFLDSEGKSPDICGQWIYYPWLREMVHLLREEEYAVVRSSRNNTLIRPDDQKKLYHTTVGIVGLSIGSSVAIALALVGGGKRIKLADGDSLELSNLNRIAGGVTSLGIPKAELAARAIYLLNPYTDIEIGTKRMTERDVAAFIKDVDIIVDECDDFALKHSLRRGAKKLRIPVISGADVGEKAVIDVERYDMDAELRVFAGRITEMSTEQISHLDKAAVGQLIAKLIGEEHLDIRMRESIQEIGSTIVSWPQLGTTALLNGAAVAQIIALIATGRPTQDRYVLPLPAATKNA